MAETVPVTTKNEPGHLKDAEHTITNIAEQVDVINADNGSGARESEAVAGDSDGRERDGRSNGVEDSSNDGEEESDQDGESGSESEAVITLVEGRERRSTAGNRLSKLLDQEGDAEEDEVAMLFAEVGDEDVEFEDPDAVEASDIDDDSSTDNEDQGPTAGEDDLEGEKQLAKEERNERKRKAAKPFLKASTGRKRVKIDESATPSSAAEPPPKKVERLSWIRKATNAPKRTSSRTLSIQNKERTLASMKESEKKRMRQQAVLEATQRRREAERNKPMTQEERLEEAARTEELNSKSLNRWEEMERERVEKQKARLEALQNRKLEGPVIRWYSGPAEWVDGTLQRVGKKKTQLEEVKEDFEAVQAPEAESSPAKDPVQGVPLLNIDASQPDAMQVNEMQIGANASGKSAPLVDDPYCKGDETLVNQTTTVMDIESKKPDDLEETRDQGSTNPEKLPERDQVLEENTTEATSANADDNEPMQNSLLDDIFRYASMEEPSTDEHDNQLPSTTEKDVENRDSDQTIGSTSTHQVNHDPEAAATYTTPPVSSSRNLEIVDGETRETPSLIKEFSETPAATYESTENEAQTTDSIGRNAPASRQPTPKVDYSARNLITLMNFDQNAIRDRDVQRRVLFKWQYDQVPPTSHTGRGGLRTAQLQPAPRSSCAITHQSARYKDPETGLPYANLDSYRAIRRLVAGGCRWSDLLGAWVGGEVPAESEKEGVFSAARGVPPGFERPLPPQSEIGAEDGNMTEGAVVATADGSASVKVEGGS